MERGGVASHIPFVFLGNPAMFGFLFVYFFNSITMAKTKAEKIKNLENQIEQLEREHQKRLLCLRKLLVEELKSGG